MYKWLWLGVAVTFLAPALWMLNDIRLQVRRSSQTIQAAGPALDSLKATSATINEKLPGIVDRTQKTSDVVAASLPQVVDRIDATTETLAELSADVRALKQLAGLAGKPRDDGLVAYANSLLDKLATSEGFIGNKKVVGAGLKNRRPAAEWVVGARREALVQLLLARSRKEMLDRLARTALGGHWYIELPGQAPITLTDWAKAHHPESKGL